MEFEYLGAIKMPRLTPALGGSAITLELAQELRGLWRRSAFSMQSRLHSTSFRTHHHGPGLCGLYVLICTSTGVLMSGLGLPLADMQGGLSC